MPGRRVGKVLVIRYWEVNCDSYGHGVIDMTLTRAAAEDVRREHFRLNPESRKETADA